MPTQTEIAVHLDLSQKQVSDLLNDMQIDWRVETMDVIRIAYIRRLRGAASGHRSESGVDLTHERAMTERVEREIKLLDLAERRGQLVNVGQIEPELQQLFVAFRAELLSSDDALKADLDALYGIDVDLGMLNQRTHDALSHLARYDPERAGLGASAGSASDAAAADVDGGLGEDVPEDESESLGQAR